MAVLIDQYRSRGLSITRILELLHIPESTYYRKPSMIGMRRGRKRTVKTELSSGDEKIMIHDTQILGDIRELLSEVS